MEINPSNILDVANRNEFRAWLADNHESQTECWIEVVRSRPIDPETFYYIDAVEEAICFGWIDSISKPHGDTRLQRFSPRKPKSPWTELNKERARRLEKLGLMTDAGRAVLPPMGPRNFKPHPDFEAAMKAARCWSAFKRFPPLYQRVRAYNVAFYIDKNPEAYEHALSNLISYTKRGEMFGEWNDFGRLLDY